MSIRLTPAMFLQAFSADLVRNEHGCWLSIPPGSSNTTVPIPLWRPPGHAILPGHAGLWGLRRLSYAVHVGDPAGLAIRLTCCPVEPGSRNLRMDNCVEPSHMLAGRSGKS